MRATSGSPSIPTRRSPRRWRWRRKPSRERSPTFTCPGDDRRRAVASLGVARLAGMRQRAEGTITMLSRAFALLTMVVAMFASTAPAGADQPNWPPLVIIATASPGGTYHAYGQGLAKLLTRVLDLP